MPEIGHRLLDIATRVRAALEVPTVTHNKFPWNYCTGATKLLGKYLVEAEGIVPVEGVANAYRFLPSDYPDDPKRQTHMWLEYGGYIMDITADQFEDVSEPVIVTKDRRWHDQFLWQTRVSQHDLLMFNAYLDEKYRLMVQQMNIQAGG